MLAPSGRLARCGPGVLVTALLSTVLTGCAAMEPPLEDPSGVDSLTVPTPSLDPQDLVAQVNHPWLGTNPAAVGEDGTLVQSDDGHVWLRPTSGETGDGDENEAAGLWLPAEPRRGDGWVVVPGTDPRLASVLATEPDLVVVLSGAGRPTSTYTYRRGEGLLTSDGG